MLQEAVELAPRRRRPVVRLDPQLVSMRTDHLLTLVDDVGIVQHANGVIPNRESGYCVDDVARLAVVALELARRGDEQVWTSIVYRSLAFLQDATDPEEGMRNFMGYDRRWLDEPHIGDHVGRSIWSLGEILSTAWVPAVVGPTRRLLDTIVGTLGRTRRCAPARTPCSDSPGSTRTGCSPEALLLLERVVDQLADAYETHSSAEWRWFEDALTYDNARLPHALIVGGVALGREDLTETGLEALRWLGDESGLARRHAPADRPSRPARTEPAPGGGDEQPLDASAFVAAELAAFVRHRRSGAREARAAVIRLVPRPQPAPPAAVRLRHRRLQRRARRGDDERQPGRRIDARLPPRRAAARRGRTARRPPHPRDCHGVNDRELFDRHPANPILTAEDWPYPVNAVFNPAAAQLNGTTVLLARVEDLTGISHLSVARSSNGIDGWTVDPEPLLAPADGIESEQWGFEDARVVFVPELERWVITCTAYGPAGPAVFLATTEDFTSVERHGIVRQPEDKNAALLPQRVDGKWILFHRPTTGFGARVRTARSTSPAQPTSSTGARPSRCCSRATAPGGTRAASASGRRCCEPSTAGC